MTMLSWKKKKKTTAEKRQKLAPLSNMAKVIFYYSCALMSQSNFSYADFPSNNYLLKKKCKQLLIDQSQLHWYEFELASEMIFIKAIQQKLGSWSMSGLDTGFIITACDLGAPTASLFSLAKLAAPCLISTSSQYGMRIKSHGLNEELFILPPYIKRGAGVLSWLQSNLARSVSCPWTAGTYKNWNLWWIFLSDKTIPLTEQLLHWNISLFWLKAFWSVIISIRLLLFYWKDGNKDFMTYSKGILVWN